MRSAHSSRGSRRLLLSVSGFRALLVAAAALVALLLLLGTRLLVLFADDNNNSNHHSEPEKSHRPEKSHPSVAAPRTLNSLDAVEDDAHVSSYVVLDARYPHLRLAVCRHPHLYRLLYIPGTSNSSSSSSTGRDSNDRRTLLEGEEGGRNDTHMWASDLSVVDAQADVEAVRLQSTTNNNNNNRSKPRQKKEEGGEKNNKDSLRHANEVEEDPSCSLHYLSSSAQPSKPLTYYRRPRKSPSRPRLCVVIGVPTVDTPLGAERRDVQRRSWLRYPQVLNGGAADGRVLVRYLVARHPSHGYAFSAAVVAEGRRTRDVLLLELLEGRPTTAKVSGAAGHWGLAAEVGMSRKALAWYALAPRLYDFDFIAKADDDVFLRVPAYLAALEGAVVPLLVGESAAGRALGNRLVSAALTSSNEELTQKEVVKRCSPTVRLLASSQAADTGGVSSSHQSEVSHLRSSELCHNETIRHLFSLIANAGEEHGKKKKEKTCQFSDARFQESLPPTAGLYWGKAMKWLGKKGDPNSLFLFAGGMTITMSRNVAATVTDDGALYALSIPFLNFKENAFPSSSLPLDTSNDFVSSVLNVGRRNDGEDGAYDSYHLLEDLHSKFNKKPRPSPDSPPPPTLYFLPEQQVWRQLGRIRHQFIKKSKLHEAGGAAVDVEDGLGEDPLPATIVDNDDSPTNKLIYKAFNMDHEDVMVGRALTRFAAAAATGNDNDKEGKRSALSSDFVSDLLMREMLRRSDGTQIGKNDDSNSNHLVASLAACLHSPNTAGSSTSSTFHRSPKSLRTVTLRDAGILLVDDKRYHDVHSGANQQSVRSSSCAVHHLRPQEYQDLMQRFPPLPLREDNDDAKKPPPVFTAREAVRHGHSLLSLT